MCLKLCLYATIPRYFASGTGAAGLVGAFLWWEVRSLGVRVGVGLSSVGVVTEMASEARFYQMLSFLSHRYCPSPYHWPTTFFCRALTNCLKSMPHLMRRKSFPARLLYPILHFLARKMTNIAICSTIPLSKNLAPSVMLRCRRQTSGGLRSH